jgi:hypothetical protein
MTRGALRWLAWGLAGLWAVMSAVTIWLFAAGSATLDQALVVMTVGFAVVGALVAVREPANAVGWLMLGIADSYALQGLVDAYVAEPGRPGWLAVAWVASWAWYLWLYGAGLLLPLLFPDGRLLSPRWRPAIWMAGAALALAILTEGLRAGPLDVETADPVANPLGVGGVAGHVVEVAGSVGGVLAATGFVLGGVSLVQRLRRSTGRQRQQVKWFAYVGALAMAGLLMAMSAEFAAAFVEEADAPTWALVIGSVGWFAALLLIVLGIPAAVGIAILRHRLYDIDVVIKRTLVYGSLTATLALSYLGLVLLFRLVLAPLTEGSDLAVAGSTLAVAALFRPLRSRIQAVVDRRFFRARYDAAQTLQGFAGRLRDELDLETLGVDLRQAVRDTMAPAHVSLWLREVPR